MSEEINSQVGEQNVAPPSLGYFALTKTYTYSYLFVVPLIILYELGSRFVNQGAIYQIRVGADVWVKKFLDAVGLHSTLVTSVLLVLVGLAIMLYENRIKKVVIRPYYFIWMFLESSLYAAIIGPTVNLFLHKIVSLQIHDPSSPLDPRLSTLHQLVLSLGAGIYEEFVFRLILTTIIYKILFVIPVPVGKSIRFVSAAILSALVFSAVHYVGVMGDTFTIQSFTFRFVMGLVLNIIFLTRGFGMAAMTHALYDVFVTLV
ncbi:MAG: CPBP family intramembrane metalloprotease [Chlorobi bacterium]|jgi:hypothetical protein|nr:CPBP family intramembrane metalloprotease [Chlorobiota bacterium]